MIVRIAIASIAIGLILLVGGMFLSEGYSARQGFLGSLPKMKFRLTADERNARFLQVLRSSPDDAGVMQIPASHGVAMDDVEISQVFEAFVAQELGTPKPGYTYSFDGWTVQRGTTFPLGRTLAIASALVIIGAAMLIGVLFGRARRTTEPPMTSTLETSSSDRPAITEAHTPMKRSRLRLALHLWGGVCLKVAADISGLVVVRGASGIESAQASAAAAGLIAVLLILTGYYLSYQFVSVLDKAPIASNMKKITMLLLPIAYFVSAVIVGGMASLLGGPR